MLGTTCNRAGKGACSRRHIQLVAQEHACETGSTGVECGTVCAVVFFVGSGDLCDPCDAGFGDGAGLTAQRQGAVEHVVALITTADIGASDVVRQIHTRCLGIKYPCAGGHNGVSRHSSSDAECGVADGRSAIVGLAHIARTQGDGLGSNRQGASDHKVVTEVITGFGNVAGLDLIGAHHHMASTAGAGVSGAQAKDRLSASTVTVGVGIASAADQGDV